MQNPQSTEAQMTVYFKATKKQLLQMAANATNASTPTGLSILQYDKEEDFKPEDFEKNLRPVCLNLDYVHGRMVKLWIDCATDTEDPEIRIYCMIQPRPDYQSWAHKYPTAEKLIESVGAEVLQADRPPKEEA